ncbi:MAG: hypothetical protein AB1649_23155, partial [Chloroflexota bacterium]
MPIRNWDEFYELEELVREVGKRLKLGAYGHSREQAINVGKRLLREWEESQSQAKSQRQKDEEHL